MTLAGRGCWLPWSGYLEWPCSLAVHARKARELQQVARSLRERLRPRRLESSGTPEPADPAAAARA